MARKSYNSIHVLIPKPRKRTSIGGNKLKTSSMNKSKRRSLGIW